MIVHVTEENIADAGLIHSESWKESHRSFCSAEFVAKHTPEAQTDYLRRELAAGKHVYMLVDGVPVGIVSVDGSVIENLYVLPRHQNKGYGGQLLRFAVSRCVGTPTLWILNTNQGAYRLYSRNGFIETGSQKALKNNMFEMEMQYSRLEKIRRAEALSHTEAYTANGLFEKGSWLAKPVNSVLELLPLFAQCKDFRALDLGCGVGRNSIPVAQAVPGIVDCVDILDMAIEKLRENAEKYGVADSIRGVVSGIDQYPIEKQQYDLILAISALEHMDSPDSMIRKLREIRDGTRENGAVCLVMNTSVRERDKDTGAPLAPRFEVNMDSAELQNVLDRVFEGWTVLKSTVTHQRYDIPRERGMAELETDVLTFAAQKKESL